MHHLKRNTNYSILVFLSIILTLTNYLQILTEKDIAKIDQRNSSRSIAKYFLKSLYL